MQDTIMKESTYLANFPQLKIKEYDYLLQNNSFENKNLFIAGFMTYIYRVAKYIYLRNKQYFVVGYSFADLLSDGVIVATDFYNAGEYQEFYVFQKYFYFRYMRYLVNNQVIKPYSNKEINSINKDMMKKMLLDDTFEDALLDKINHDCIREEVLVALKRLPRHYRTLVSTINGIDTEMRNMAMISRDAKVTKQAVRAMYNRALDRLEIRNPQLIKYLD